MPLALQLALRELRGGLRGFGIFLACIILGVAAIAAVGALRDSVVAGIAENGQVLLGGDVELRQSNLPLAQDVQAWLAREGEISQTVTMRGMASNPDNGERSFLNSTLFYRVTPSRHWRRLGTGHKVGALQRLCNGEKLPHMLRVFYF